MNRWLIFSALCFLGTMPGRAGEPAPITDPAQVTEHYRQVVARPEYREIEEPDVNAHFKEILSQWFTRLGVKIGEFKYAGRMPAFESFLMTLLVGLALAALLYIMVRLTRRRKGMEPEPASETFPGQKIFRPPEFYDEEIRLAIHAGDWHTAWLTAWRQFLSRLENRNLVEADRTRTNREYLAQLRIQTLPAPALALLTGMVDAYDRFIYGRKFIGEPEWSFFHQQINETALLLHLDDKNAGARAKPGAS